MADTDKDVIAITNLINLYGLVMDTQRWDMFDRLFTSDVDADYGEGSHWRDLAKFKADFGAFHKIFDATQHLMSNHLVNVQGDTAEACTYGNWRLIRKGLEGGDLWEGTGWYDDKLVRQQGRWLIKHRVCRILYWSGNPLVQAGSGPDVKFNLHSTMIKGEAEAGRIGYLNAIARK